MDKKRRQGDVLRAHEEKPICPIKPLIKRLQDKDSSRDLFLEGDAEKKKLYTYLAVFIDRIWKNVEARLRQDRLGSGRHLHLTAENQAPHPNGYSIEEIFRRIDASPSLFIPVRIIFDHFHARFQDETEREVVRSAREKDPIYLELIRLMLANAQTNPRITSLERLLVSGFGTSRHVMTFIACRAPDIYQHQCGTLPDPATWIRLLRNSEKFILLMAAKDFHRLFSLTDVIKGYPGSFGTDAHDFWNPADFCIEGEEDQQSLVLTQDALKRISEDSPVPSAPSPQEHKPLRPRIGCPALYVGVIQSLYRAYIKDIEEYLVPRYRHLTRSLSR